MCLRMVDGAVDRPVRDVGFAMKPAADLPLRYDFEHSSANPNAPILDGVDEDGKVDADALDTLCVQWLTRFTGGSHRRAMHRCEYLKARCRFDHRVAPDLP